MDSESQEKSMAPAAETNGEAASPPLLTFANESEHNETDVAQGSKFHHAGLQGSGIILPRQLCLTRSRSC